MIPSSSTHFSRQADATCHLLTRFRGSICFAYAQQTVQRFNHQHLSEIFFSPSAILLGTPLCWHRIRAETSPGAAKSPDVTAVVHRLNQPKLTRTTACGYVRESSPTPWMFLSARRIRSAASGGQAFEDVVASVHRRSLGSVCNSPRGDSASGTDMRPRGFHDLHCSPRAVSALRIRAKTS
jgi:hypothetical protein